MEKREIIEYYSRKDVISQMVRNSRDREVAGVYPDGSYDSRPNMLQFPSDVGQMAKKGISSFHFSVERWSNPMAIRQENYDKLRTGWDLLIDIDSKLGLGESKLAARLICRLLRKYGIRKHGLKFSGRRGFHICVPWESFPKEIDYKPLQSLYPKAPRIIASYIRKRIAKKLMKGLIMSKGAKELIAGMDEPPGRLNPFYFVEVEKNWGARHMFRAPYSLNEKTWLASAPLELSGLRNFSPEDARPEKMQSAVEFFLWEENSAESLLLDAFDWHAMNRKEEEKKPRPAIAWEKKIGEGAFPPCMKLILEGMQDGRKRSLFMLINFLRMMNWQWEEIEQKVEGWNGKNMPPLPRSYVLSQLRYQQQHGAKPPANCDVSAYYSDIGICRPDSVCRGGKEKITIKNPVNYPFRTMRLERRELKDFSCIVCKKGFPTPRSLELHKGRMH